MIRSDDNTSQWRTIQRFIPRYGLASATIAPFSMPAFTATFV